MNEEQKKILQNFTNLEEELLDSPYTENLKILRQAWNIEIQKPGCTQCIKNGAKNKYTQIASNMILHGFSIEEAKSVNDKRNELNKKHAEVAKEIENEIQATIKEMKGETENVDTNKSLLESLVGGPIDNPKPSDMAPQTEGVATEGSENDQPNPFS